MKKFMKNVFVTTGISLILLSLIALFHKAEWLYIPTVFQVFGANIVVHLGMSFTQTLELKYDAVKIILDITLVIGVLILFGTAFHWFASTPITVLACMGIVIYAVSFLLDLIRMKREAEELNALIKKRNSEQIAE